MWKSPSLYVLFGRTLILFVVFVGLQKPLQADSLHVKSMRHYIRPCIYYNHYSTPQRRASVVKQYRFAENNLGFYFPLLTSTWFNKDSASLSSLHLVLISDFMQYKPQINFLNESYKIGRISTGIRLFYSTGNKSVFYFTMAPFVSQETQYFNRAKVRFSSAIVYSRTVSRNFAYRIGFARTYTYGKALHLPIIGIRIGPLDKLHFNIQFPRNASIDIPIGKKIWISIFSKSMGGIYNVAMQDSILAPKGTTATLRRFELLNGSQFSMRASDYVSFYVSIGFATRRYINFAYKEDKAFVGPRDKTVEKIPNSLFVSLGVSVRFGKAKRVYNNSTLYDVFDMNTMNRAGFTETGPMDNDVPASSEKYKLETLRNLKYKDVEDLVTDDY